ncbi:MAG: hypoxanthine phosphoribosyltransferase [Bacteroidota bacterium]|jgi:hypoxanthine phosphoribosyltransferase
MAAVQRIHDKQFEVYLSSNQIQSRVQELAKTLENELKGQEVLFLAILNGSFLFAADVMRHIEGPAAITFVKVSSYQGTQSTGRVDELIGLQTSLKGKHVVILEDIIDTGVTMDKVMTLLSSEAPASLRICTLLFKPTAFKGKQVPDFIGFEIPDKFVVGYGLDYNELGRNLNAIYQVIN